jgi:hypothetical protein
MTFAKNGSRKIRSYWGLAFILWGVPVHRVLVSEQDVNSIVATPFHLDCIPGSGPRVRVSQDSVSGIWLGAPIGSLLNLCHAFAETSFAQGRYPAVVIHFGRTRVIGVQYKEARLRLNRPADGWVVLGVENVFVGRAPADSGWGRLQHAYGSVQWVSRGTLVARFCELPRIVFTLRADSVLLERVAREGAGSIPDDVKVNSITVLRPELAAAFSPCSVL